MKLTLSITGAIALMLLAAAGVAAALDPGAFALVAAVLTDPHVQAGVITANGVAAIDPAAVQAELRRIANSVTDICRPLEAKQSELQARLQDVERKAARPQTGGGDGPLDTPQLAAQMAETEGFEALRRGLSKEFRFEIPAGGFRAAITNDGSLATTVPMPDLLITPGMRRATVRDLLTSVPTTAAAVPYMRETDFANNAALVTESSAKPESTIEYELRTAQIVTIAHYVHVSRQALDDLNMLENLIRTRLKYGLMLKEEEQLLRGSGVGNNLEGLYTAATAYAAPSGISVTAEQRIDRLRIAIAQLAASDYIATGILLNPIDWANIELAKQATTNAYLWSEPQRAATPMLWGIPVVPTNAVNQDTFLIGDFQSAAILLDREAVRIDIALEDQDDFVRNMIKVRCEERIGLAVRLPQALIKGADLSP